MLLDWKYFYLCMIKQINVTDGLVLNRATSVPKSILHQMLEKGLTPVWYLNFFSEFQVVPNKSPMNELNKRQETLSIYDPFWVCLLQ